MSSRHEALARINETFAAKGPYNAWLGLVAVDFGEGRAAFRLPHRPRHVGDPDRGVPHGGVVTAAMDATAGAAVFLALDRPLRIATLDLRLDYVQPPPAERDLFFEAHCHRVTTHIAFVRGLAHGGDATDPFVSCAATFMLFHGQPSALLQADGDPT